MILVLAVAGFISWRALFGGLVTEGLLHENFRAFGFTPSRSLAQTAPTQEEAAMAGESIKSGLTAGFAASAAVGALMIIKTQLGSLPQLNPIGDIVAILDRYTGLQFPPDTGWVGHFIIGAVGWGVIYTWIRTILPGPAVVKGLIFGVLAWLAMMIVFMPVAGHGFFGLSLGIAAPVATFAQHLVFGAVLGTVYASTRSSAAIDNVTPALFCGDHSIAAKRKVSADSARALRLICYANRRRAPAPKSEIIADCDRRLPYNSRGRRL